MVKRRRNFRLWVQLIYAALTNGYVNGFIQGKIYTGPAKQLCVPGLNCYSCPGALGACPIGSLQAVIGSREYRFSFYVVGFFMAVGAFMGRFVCGWLCPFGLVQDLLYKIPLLKKVKRLPKDKYLRYLKYIILIVFVIILPIAVVNIFGQGSPWFCQWICPSGMLFGGIPLVSVNEGLRSAAGWLFQWKLFILLAVIILSVKVYRPFCRYLCPLGAVYSVFNPLAVYRFRIAPEKCTHCRQCDNACPMAIEVSTKPNSPECIRCGKCLAACPHEALTSTFKKRGKKVISQ